MNKNWLILDCNFLCHRAKHSINALSYGGKPTEVIYSFLKNIPALQELFGTSHIAFCWDSKTNKRVELYPEYKAKRYAKEQTEEEIQFDKAFRYQMKKLRVLYLKAIGFRNVFVQPGYEADDIIASLCHYSLEEGDTAIIISSDQDMYQLITPYVTVYNPIKLKQITLQGFKKRYGIHPQQWSFVKMYAGCSGDNVKGIHHVGEVTAIKYIKGQLKKSTKVYQSLVSEKGIQIAHRNRFLVQLPFEGVKIFKLRKDQISEEGWVKVTETLGMKSIRDRVPFGPRRKRSNG